MKGYGDETYGDRIAAIYDGHYLGLQTEATVDALARLAGQGQALELGIGTGRVALPLHRRGVRVSGVDASAEMVARLREQATEEEIPVTMGSFARELPGGPYELVYVVFNTFFALLTQEEQVGCFSQVARRLAPGGSFLLECFVPDMGRFTCAQSTMTTRMDLDELEIDATLHDPVTQTVQTQHLIFTKSGTTFYPVALRYAWPSELDLMARLAGLRLASRWGGWDGRPFGAKSENHISIYRLDEENRP